MITGRPQAPKTLAALDHIDLMRLIDIEDRHAVDRRRLGDLHEACWRDIGNGRARPIELPLDETVEREG